MEPAAREKLRGVEPSHICLTTRTQRCLNDRYRPLLENAHIDTVVLDKDTPESEFDQGAVRLATMHRMKGLEFPRVLMAGTLNARRNSSDFADRASQEDHDQQERSLSCVAATRARDVLVVCNHGDGSY